jgi:hypothetical protein
LFGLFARSNINTTFKKLPVGPDRATKSGFREQWEAGLGYATPDASAKIGGNGTGGDGGGGAGGRRWRNDFPFDEFGISKKALLRF